MLKLEALIFLQVQVRSVLFALRLSLNYFRCELSLIKKNSIFLIRKTNKYEVKSTLFVHSEFKRKLKKHLNRMTNLDA